MSDSGTVAFSALKVDGSGGLNGFEVFGHMVLLPDRRPFESTHSKHFGFIGKPQSVEGSPRPSAPNCVEGLRVKPRKIGKILIVKGG
jgi:hypothetical protein